MFRAHVIIIRGSKLHYTASGIITPVGGRLVHYTIIFAHARNFEDILYSTIVLPKLGTSRTPAIIRLFCLHAELRGHPL